MEGEQRFVGVRLIFFIGGMSKVEDNSICFWIRGKDSFRARAKWNNAAMQQTNNTTKLRER